jgi:hypothetical protein
MKTVFIILSLLVCLSCNSLKNFEESPECPEGYNCEAEIIKETSILLLEDTIGKNYVKLEDSDKYHTIKYTYGYQSPPQLADANYSEVVFFQIPVDTDKLQLSGKEVITANFIIAKHCFCPDAGYEIINDGTINVTVKDNRYYVSLDFLSNKEMRLNNIKTIVGL